MGPAFASIALASSLALSDDAKIKANTKPEWERKSKYCFCVLVKCIVRQHLILSKN
jgi:hypothetical protein